MHKLIHICILNVEHLYKLPLPCPSVRHSCRIRTSFFFAKVLREFRETFAEEFCYFDGIANFFFGNFLVKDLMTPPSPPLGVENVKIRENSEKFRGPPGTSKILTNLLKRRVL